MDWSPAQTEKLRALWEQGLRAPEIARRLGDRSSSEVRRKACALNLPRFRPGMAPEHGVQMAGLAGYREALARSAAASRQVAETRAAVPLRPVAVSAPAPHALTCQWPLWGDDAGPGEKTRFCGAATVLVQHKGRVWRCAYCAEHAAVAFHGTVVERRCEAA